MATVAFRSNPMKKRSSGGGAVVKGGNSAKALRSAKRNRYGKEQFKIRYPTHYQYCLRLLTYTTNQTVDPQINADLPETPVTSTAATFGYNLEPEGGTQTYFSLNPRVAAPNTNGLTSLNACGLYSLPIKRLILKSMPTCPRRR